MAGQLVLLCNVERLPTLDDGVAALGFGLNFSVAWSAAEDPAAEAMLKPWRWGVINAIRFQWKKVGGASAELPQTAPCVTQDGVASPDAMKEFVNRLEREYTAAAKRKANLHWEPPAAGRQIKEEETLDEQLELKPWHTLLMHVSTFPFPLPQSVNLSRLFRVPPPPPDAAAADKWELIAAPILAKAPGGGFPAEDLLPEGSSEPTAQENVIAWKYAGGLASAYLMAAPSAVSGDNFIDLGDQWLRSPGGAAGSLGADWQTKLEVRMSDAFQLTHAVLDFIRGDERHDPAGLLEKGNNLRVCVEMAMAALRDVVGLGLKPYPNGARLAQRIFEGRGDAAISGLNWDEIETQAGTAEAALFGDLPGWKRLLREKLPGAAGLKILKEPFEWQTVPQSLSELERLTELAFDARTQNSLWTLFLEQWSEVLKRDDIQAAKPILQRRLEELKKEGSPSEIDLRQQLALSNLGRFWQAFIGSNRAGDDPRGHNLITVCFPAHLLAYAERRLGLSTAGVAEEPDCKLTDPTGKCAPPPPPPRLVPPAPAPGTDLNVKLVQSLRCWAARAAAAAAPTAAEEPAETPRPITFQVSRLDREPEGSALFQDILKKISGLGVLMREKGTPTWMALNLADVSSSRSRLDLGGMPVLAPYRLHYQSGLRQVSISYSNRPLVGDDPLSHREMTGSVALYGSDPGDDGIADQLHDVLAQYHYNVNTTRRPGLKFGRIYELAIFAITNSGKLPKELADPTSPCRPRYKKPTPPSQVLLLDPVAEPPANTILKASYSRTVRIGSLRLSSTNEVTGVDGYRLPDPRVRFPAIPPNVSPRVRDLEVFNTREVTAAAAAAAGRKEEMPLVLLSPASWATPERPSPHQFEFKVRGPAVSWECWDYWKFGDEPEDKARREAVAADHFRRMKVNRERGEKNQPALDIQLDDPALTPRLYFELWREKDGDMELLKSSENKTRLSVVVAPAQGSGLRSEQARGVRVRCEYLAADSEEAEGLSLLPTEAGKLPGVRVKVREGQVYRLTTCASLPSSHLKEPNVPNRVARFDPSTVVVYGTDNEGADTLVSPTHIALEAATTKLPSASELWAAFRVKFFEDAADKRWKVTTELKGGPGAFSYLHRAEVQRQVWRWQGRATAPHPQLETNYVIGDDWDYPGGEAGKDDETLRKLVQVWEAVEFGDRPDSDHVVLNMAVSRDGRAGTAARGVRDFRYDELLGGDDGKYELRGLHFRFALRAYSRYEGILPPGSQTFVEAAELRPDPKAPGGSVQNRWRGQFVPSRRQPPLDAPKVRIVMPLTETFERNSPGASPGLLVVLDETWHEVGGLGETLEAAVELSPDLARPPGSPPKSYFELGPDPIVSSTGRLTEQEPGSTSVFFDRNLLRGPVGHYSDSDNTSALFIGTSFIIPPPTVPLAAPNLAWYFAKIRVRRALTVRLPLNDGARRRYKPDASWARREIRSAFTDPIWVQYLPEFSIFVGPVPDVSLLRAQVDASAEKLLLLDADRKAVSLKQEHSETNIFSLYAVLTRSVFDVAGNAGQEAYAAVFARCERDERREDGRVVSLEEWKLIDGDLAQLVEGRYRVRIIEVQTPKEHPLGVLANPCAPDFRKQPFWFWDALFGKGDTAQPGSDLKARIVRISEPIESGDAAGEPCED